MIRLLAITMRPLALAILFVVAYWSSKWITRIIPEGNLKEVLTRPMRVRPRTDQEQKDWRPVLYPVIAWLLLMALLWYSDPLRH